MTFNSYWLLSCTTRAPCRSPIVLTDGHDLQSEFPCHGWSPPCTAPVIGSPRARPASRALGRSSGCETFQPGGVSVTREGARFIDGSARCCAISAARSRAAARTNLARSNQSLFLRSRFGGAKRSAPVNIFMICPRLVGSCLADDKQILPRDGGHLMAINPSNHAAGGTPDPRNGSQSKAGKRLRG